MTRIILPLFLLLFATRVTAGAAETETRIFNVHVAGKPAGQYHLTIHHDRGTHTVTCQADVNVRILLVKYTYSYRGTEVWKDGRLQRLESQTNDDGKHFTVHATADGERLRVRSNGAEHHARPDVWTTSYWHLADAKFHNQAVPLLDADTGKEFHAKLHYVGTQAISVAGQVQNCSHYRVSGGKEADLWYDAGGRLVRQESVEDGYRTLMELAQIRR